MKARSPRMTGTTADTEKFMTALRSYKRTLDMTGSIMRDGKLKEFLSLGQQVIGDLPQAEAEDFATIMKWYRASKRPSFEVV